jgi:hypothetical protein
VHILSKKAVVVVVVVVVVENAIRKVVEEAEIDEREWKKGQNNFKTELSQIMIKNKNEHFYKSKYVMQRSS